jgi:cold shock CspA family protein
VATASLQGVVKSYDPITGDGTVISDSTLTEYELSRDALRHSVFRMLRQGQRILFDLNEQQLAVHVRVGSEADMGTPGFAAVHPDDVQHPQGGDEA